MVLRFFMLAVAFLLSCSEFERGNPYDAEGTNYGNKGKDDDKDKDSQAGSWTESPKVEQIEYKFTDPRDNKIYDAIEFRITRGSNSKYGIAEIDSNITWIVQNLNWDAPAGSICYDNDETKCATYGRLYDFETAKTACPSGWHLPIDGEEKLVTYEYVNCYNGNCNKYTSDLNYILRDGVFRKYYCTQDKDNYSCSETWIVGSLGGIGYSNENFSDINTVGYWWTGTEGKAGKAYYIYGQTVKHSDDYDDDELKKSLTDKSNFLSVRCVQD